MLWQLSVYVDARPALDTPSAVADRLVFMPIHKLVASLKASSKAEKQ